jgi:Mn2+/Fe2+ NRAMP family transporter
MDKEPFVLEQEILPPVGVDLETFTLAYLACHEAECPACGYNVHKLTEARCPECGKRLAVQVVAAIGGLSTPWLVAMVALGLTAGIGLLFAATAVKQSLPSWQHEPWLVFLIIYFMCNVPFPILLLILRRWFVRQGRGVQWGITLPAAVVTAAMVLGLLLKLGR